MAIHARGAEAFNAGRIEEADSLFTEALRLVPWHYQTIVEAIQLHAVTGDWSRASALFDRAVTLHPRSRRAYRLFARRLLEAGRPAEARRIALQGIGRVEQSPGPLWALVADAWEDEGREVEAARVRRAAQTED